MLQSKVQAVGIARFRCVDATPRGGGGVELDPLVGLNDQRKPLRSRLLSVPSLKARYLGYVRDIAQEQLNWKKLGPVVGQYRTLIEKEVEADTRKLYPLAAFQNAVADRAAPAGGPGMRGALSLKAFAEQRSSYLLKHSAIRQDEKRP